MVTDLWARDTLAATRSWTRVKINGMALGLLSGGQSTAAPTLEYPREAARACRGTGASR
jgi:hypothetical protein